MMYFTQEEELCPSEKTLDFIRQFAYTYRSVNINGRQEAYCLN